MNCILINTDLFLILRLIYKIVSNIKKMFHDIFFKIYSVLLLVSFVLKRNKMLCSKFKVGVKR